MSDAYSIPPSEKGRACFIAADQSSNQDLIDQLSERYRGAGYDTFHLDLSGHTIYSAVQEQLDDLVESEREAMEALSGFVNPSWAKRPPCVIVTGTSSMRARNRAQWAAWLSNEASEQMQCPCGPGLLVLIDNSDFLRAAASVAGNPSLPATLDKISMSILKGLGACLLPSTNSGEIHR